VIVDLHFSLEPHIHQQVDMTHKNSRYYASCQQQQPTWSGFASLTTNSGLGK
jgi:hypothetical protein